MVGASVADIVEDCQSLDDPGLQIEACTTAIDLGEWAGANVEWAHHFRGYGYSRLGQYERAITDYDHALRLDPGYIEVYLNRGYAYVSLGQHERALADYDQYVRSDPSYPLAFYDRGTLRLQLGRYEHAVEDFGQAIRLDPAYAEAHYNRAIAYCLLGDSQLALRDLLPALRQLGSSASANLQRHLANQGLYAGPIDGSFGPASVSAFEAWTAAGCPGV